MYPALSGRWIQTFVYSSGQPHEVGTIIWEMKEQAGEGDGTYQWRSFRADDLLSSTTRGISCRYWASPGYPTYVRAGGPQRNSEIASVTSILQMWEWTGSKSLRKQRAYSMSRCIQFIDLHGIMAGLTSYCPCPVYTENQRNERDIYVLFRRYLT